MKKEDRELMRRLVDLLERKKLEVVEPLHWQSWMEGFLKDLERHDGNASAAIELCEMSRDTVYRYRRRNPEFARKWVVTQERCEAERQRRFQEEQNEPSRDDS